MRKVILLGLLWFVAMALFWSAVPKAHADYYNYPCNYPFVGTSGSVQALATGGGQYCDGPTEINGTHYHCMSGGGGISGGGLALAPLGGLTFGAIGGSGFGISLGDCHYVCPDLFRPPDGFPNPPAAWVKPLTVTPKNNICRDHMDPAGPDGAPVPPSDTASPDPAQTRLQKGPTGSAPAAPAPTGPPLVTVPAPDIESPLTPGGPLPLP